MREREKLSSRLGFILLSAGCAIGLGNIWRFPYLVGTYGGAMFVLIYIVFLVILGIPIMAMEFAVGRASQRSAATSFKDLEPGGTKWHFFSWAAMAGNYMLMMFYTTVAGWILAYLFYMIRGDFVGLSTEGVGAAFGTLIGNPVASLSWMVLVCVISFGICVIGLQKGVERITKFMMSSLFVVMLVLVVRAVTLPGAGAGLSFYLKPDFAAFVENGIWNTIFAAMGQSFFTLSIGIGAMQIFGSYLGKDRRLMGEAINITILDTSVALMAGLIIFPACFAFGVNPGEGPGLVFVTLPNIFNSMPLSRLWGSLFFLFMTFAALSTVIAVFENIIAFAIDLTGCSRKKAVAYNLVAVIILSIPCALGFNLWSGVNPMGGTSNILDLEDFILSNNILPLGSLMYLLFCVAKNGWGWKNFMDEVNTGEGVKFPEKIRFYVTFILPLIVMVIFIFGYINKFLLA